MFIESPANKINSFFCTKKSPDVKFTKVLIKDLLNFNIYSKITAKIITFKMRHFCEHI
jgi:hypothetical protein